MLAIARALMSEPVLLMLDEPSLGLAPKIVGELFATIKAAAGREYYRAAGRAERHGGVDHRRSRLCAGEWEDYVSGPAPEVLANPEIKRMYLGG